LLGDDSPWVVSADVESVDDVEVTCGGMPGIEAQGFSRTPGPGSDGVHWTVTGRGEADDVADCLRESGATNVTVEEPGEPKDFEEIGP
jgi:hypothetical protein